MVQILGWFSEEAVRASCSSCFRTDGVCAKSFVRNFSATGRLSFKSSPLYTTDRKSTRLNSSHLGISYAVFCLKQKKKHKQSPLPQVFQKDTLLPLLSSQST